MYLRKSAFFAIGFGELTGRFGNSMSFIRTSGRKGSRPGRRAQSERRSTTSILQP